MDFKIPAWSILTSAYLFRDANHQAAPDDYPFALNAHFRVRF